MSEKETSSKQKGEEEDGEEKEKGKKGRREEGGGRKRSEHRRRSGEGEGVGGCGGHAAVECNGGTDGYGWGCNAAFGGPGWRWRGLPTLLGTAGLTVGNWETCRQFGRE